MYSFTASSMATILGQLTLYGQRLHLPYGVVRGEVDELLEDVRVADLQVAARDAHLNADGYVVVMETLYEWIQQLGRHDTWNDENAGFTG